MFKMAYPLLFGIYVRNESFLLFSHHLHDTPITLTDRKTHVSVT